MNSNELPTGDADIWKIIFETARSCTSNIDKLDQFTKALKESDAYPWLGSSEKSNICQNIETAVELIQSAMTILDEELESFEEGFYEQSDEEPFE